MRGGGGILGKLVADVSLSSRSRGLVHSVSRTEEAGLLTSLRLALL